MKQLWTLLAKDISILFIVATWMLFCALVPHLMYAETAYQVAIHGSWIMGFLFAWLPNSTRFRRIVSVAMMGDGCWVLFKVLAWNNEYDPIPVYAMNLFITLFTIIAYMKYGSRNN